MMNGYPRLYGRMASRPIWNCGVQAGDIGVMKDFWLQLAMTCAAGLEAADQAAYNILLSLRPWCDITRFTMSEDGWACQAGTTVPTSPEKMVRIKPLLLEQEPAWDGTFACTSAGKPHVVLHQYDRVPEWREAVERRYQSAGVSSRTHEDVVLLCRELLHRVPHSVEASEAGSADINLALELTRQAKNRETLADPLREILDHWRRQDERHDIFNPVTFNQKVLYRRIFDRRAALTQVADKAAVRSYVQARLGPRILPQLYWLTTRPDTIPFDELPDRFVVKPTHGSGWVQLVTDKVVLDRNALIETCRGWLSTSFYKETLEWVYKDIEPRILVEEFIDDGSGTAPNDYKLFVFDGTVELIQVDKDRFTNHRRRLYSTCWDKLDVSFECEDIIGDVPRPAHLAEMIDAAEKLGRDWDFIRADFYHTGKRLYFGELTLYPEAGWGRFRPKEFDRYLGQRWKLYGAP
jgi:hypothetical protein